MVDEVSFSLEAFQDFLRKVTARWGTGGLDQSRVLNGHRIRSVLTSQFSWEFFGIVTSRLKR